VTQFEWKCWNLSRLGRYCVDVESNEALEKVNKLFQSVVRRDNVVSAAHCRPSIRWSYLWLFRPKYWRDDNEKTKQKNTLLFHRRSSSSEQVGNILRIEKKSNTQRQYHHRPPQGDWCVSLKLRVCLGPRHFFDVFLFSSFFAAVGGPFPGTSMVGLAAACCSITKEQKEASQKPPTNISLLLEMNSKNEHFHSFH